MFVDFCYRHPFFREDMKCLLAWYYHIPGHFDTVSVLLQEQPVSHLRSFSIAAAWQAWYTVDLFSWPHFQQYHTAPSSCVVHSKLNHHMFMEWTNINQRTLGVSPCPGLQPCVLVWNAPYPQQHEKKYGEIYGKWTVGYPNWGPGWWLVVPSCVFTKWLKPPISISYCLPVAVI